MRAARNYEEEAQLVKRTGKASTTKSALKTSTAKSARKAPTRASRGQSKAKKATGSSVASRLPATTPEKAKAAKQKFERGIIARGEAVPAGEPLPPGATHEIVGKDAEGAPILKRRRFSLK
jgi:hypothetical protein